MKIDQNILRYGYFKSWSVACILHNIGQFFRNIKYAYQRITKGYCDADLFNLDMYIAANLNNTLLELADISHTYSSQYNDIEEWKKDVRETAEHFYNVHEDETSKPKKEADELYNQLETFANSMGKTPEDMVGNKSNSEYEELRKKWLSKEKEAWQFRGQEKNKGFEMLSKIFFSLWD